MFSRSAATCFDAVLWREIARFMPPIVAVRLAISAKSTFREAIYGIQSIVRAKGDSEDVGTVPPEPLSALLNAITAKPHYSMLLEINLGRLDLSILIAALERCRDLPYLQILRFAPRVEVPIDGKLAQFDAVWTNGGWTKLKELDIYVLSKREEAEDITLFGSIGDVSKVSFPSLEKLVCNACIPMGFIQQLTHLVELTCCTCSSDSALDLPPQIQHFGFHGQYPPDFLGRATQLKSLSFLGRDTNFVSESWMRLTGLQRLRFDCDVFGSAVDDLEDTIGQKFPLLRRLTPLFCTPESFLSLEFLTHLEFSGTFDAFDLRQIFRAAQADGALRHVEKLVIEYVNTLADIAIEALYSPEITLPSLRRIICDQFGSPDRKIVASRAPKWIEFIKAYSKQGLKAFRAAINDEVLACIVENCQDTLERLELARGHSFTSGTSLAQLSRLSKLRKLVVSNCSWPQYVAVPALSKLLHLRDLRLSLQIGSAWSVETELFLKGLPAMERLKVSHLNSEGLLIPKKIWREDEEEQNHNQGSSCCSS